jgi:hypothetical protein
LPILVMTKRRFVFDREKKKARQSRRRARNKGIKDREKYDPSLQHRFKYHKITCALNVE